MSSRKPQRLMLITDGAPLIVMTALIIAEDIMNTPESNKIDTAILRRRDTRRCHNIGTGIIIRAASVVTFKNTRVQKF